MLMQAVHCNRRVLVVMLAVLPTEFTPKQITQFRTIKPEKPLTKTAWQHLSCKSALMNR